MIFLRALLAVSLLISIPSPVHAAVVTTFKIDYWADNWAAVYVNGVKVATDPIPITTEKSFNKVSTTFKASYPLTIAVIAKDYVENTSGLEYIGKPNQQIGDAGLALQIHELYTGRLVAATSPSWKSLVIFKAPLNPDCVSSTNPLVDCKYTTSSAPAAWYSTKFSDSKWTNAKGYTADQVGVKEGYLEVKWNPQAKLIWSGSLTLDNTVLFRHRVTGPVRTQAFSLTATNLVNGAMTKDNSCDGAGEVPHLAWSGAPVGTKYFLLTMDTLPGPVRPGESAQSDLNHLVLYNIPVSETTLAPGRMIGVQGKNFKGTLGYTPPCSQGPGLKNYTFHLSALSGPLSGQSLTGAQAIAAAKPLLLSSVELSLSYSR